MATLRELEEWYYIRGKFNITSSEKDIDRSMNDTVIYVHPSHREADTHFRNFANSLYGKGIITHSQYKIEVDGLRFLFKYEDKVLKGDLRGYDKRKTLIINKGGL